MDYAVLIRRRRSVRRFTGEPISREDTDALLAAANLAPVGSNLYENIHLTLVQNRAVLDELGEAAVRRWENKAEAGEIAGHTPDIRLDRKMTDPFYGAPAVLFVSHRKQDLQPGIEFANAACVAYGVHLAAADRGLGSVLLWFALESMRVIPALDHTAALALPEGFAPLLGIAVGHPADAPVGREIRREIRTDKIKINYL